MDEDTIRILFLADTHLGFDLPFRPRVERRRRGDDFFDNFRRALDPAFTSKVDLVVHGGDLFYRSRVPEALIDMAMTPLIHVAEMGIPVYIVPGNHERSRIPLNLWGIHPNLCIFDQPKTFLCEIRGVKLGVSGFPFRREIRERFSDLVHQTGFESIDCDIRVLCMHQAVEGAQVGPANYTFRTGQDVIRGSDIPEDFCVLLSGHIHRAQILTRDLKNRALKAPVVYPGSVERTSFAERKEDKKFCLIDVSRDGSEKGEVTRIQFVDLPARPMETVVVKADGSSVEEITSFLKDHLNRLEADSIVRIEFLGFMADELAQEITAEKLRRIAPSSMNVTVAYPRS